MIDIDCLKVLDPDTRSELLQEAREKPPSLLATLSGVTSYSAAEAFVKGKETALTDPFVYFDEYIGPYKDIFRLIITHPDMDHMTGLYRLDQDRRKEIVNFWHSGDDDFNLMDADWGASPYDGRDWDTYKRLRRSDSSPKSLVKRQGDSGKYWTEDGIELWAPTPALEKLAAEREEPNILSMVLKISHAGRSILFGGDATAADTWPAIYPNLDMTGIDVLKASHHGRKTGYYRPAVKEMQPWLTITSVGEKAYDATEGYRRYSDYTVSLRQAGDITVTIEDGGRLLYSPNIAQHWKPKTT